MTPIKYLSVCSGIEAATVAWHPLGWQPVAFSEIDPFPRAILAHHYPQTPNLGDLTKFHEWQLPAFSLLVGGTPCQAFSIAGLRAGLADPRGNLTLTFLALARKHRPRWLVWENVPGVLSDRTNAFGHFLAGLAECGYGWAYRVLDAQYFGIPQRRRRVFVVGHLGNWQRAAEVLFERESMRGDSPPSRKTRESIAPGVAGCLGGSGQSGGFRTTDLDGTGAFIPETVGALTNGAHQGGGGLTGKMRIAEEYLPSVAWTLQERDSKGTDSDTKEGHLILMRREGNDDDRRPIAFGSKDSGQDALFDLSPTLRAGTHKKSHANSGVGPAIAFDTTQITHPENRSNPQPGDPCHPLEAKGHAPAIALNPHAHEEQERERAGIEIGPLEGLFIFCGGCGENFRGELNHLCPGCGKICGGNVTYPESRGGRPTIAIQNATRGKSQNGLGVSDPGDPMFTLDQASHHAVAFKPSHYTRGKDGAPSETFPPLSKEADRRDQEALIAIDVFNGNIGSDVCSTINAGISKQNSAGSQIMRGMKVRRLTPVECERLQGFPDNYTQIPRGKKPAAECPDGPRYKALGNSMAVPVMAWIGRRIAENDEAHKS